MADCGWTIGPLPERCQAQAKGRDHRPGQMADAAFDALSPIRPTQIPVEREEDHPPRMQLMHIGAAGSMARRWSGMGSPQLVQ